MQRHSLRLITIIAEAVIENELIHELRRLGVTGFTITDARGMGHRGIRTTGWEHGANIRVEVVCDDRMADAIAESFKAHYYENYAMILFISQVEVLRPEKFKTER